MSELHRDGEDIVTPEIKEALVATIASVRPLSRDFGRGLDFGVNVQWDSIGGSMLEQILMRMDPEGPKESDLFYLGAVLGSLAARESGFFRESPTT